MKEYRLRLLPGRTGRTEPSVTLFELADYVEHLPAGCALGRMFGGDFAVSDETRMIRELEFTIRNIAWQQGGSNGRAPERIPLPRPAHETRAADAAMDAKARAYQERQARRGGHPL